MHITPGTTTGIIAIACAATVWLVRDWHRDPERLRRWWR